MQEELVNYDDEFVFAPQKGPQTVLLACPYTEIFYGGAVGGGKTFGVMLDWCKHAQMYGEHAKGVLFRRSYPEIEDFLSKCKTVMPKLGWNFLVGQKKWIHSSGAELKLRFIETDDDAEKYQGHEYSWICIEELGQWPNFDVVNKLRARLRSAHGVPVRFLATGNPGGKGHKACKERYIDPAPPMVPHKDPKTGHSIIFIPATMEDNALLMQNDPMYAARLEGTGPAWLVRAWKQGDWTVSPQGNVFLREYFKHRYQSKNELPNFIFTVHSWDTAFKKTKDSNRSAYTYWGATRSNYYLIWAWASKVEFPELKRKAKDLYNAQLPNAVWVEDMASGQSLVQELQEDTTMPVKAIPVDGNKEARAFATTPLFESGKVLLPADAPWVDEYVEELCSFPGTADDDYVDSTSQALTYLPKMLRRLERFGNSNVIPLTGSIFGR